MTAVWPQPDAVVFPVGGEQRQHRGELFPAPRTRHGLAGQGSDQKAGASRNLDACLGGDGRSSLSEHVAAQPPVLVIERGPRQAVAVGGGEHGRAGRPQSVDKGITHRPVDDEVVL